MRDAEFLARIQQRDHDTMFGMSMNHSTCPCTKDIKPFRLVSKQGSMFVVFRSSKTTKMATFRLESEDEYEFYVLSTGFRF